MTRMNDPAPSQEHNRIPGTSTPVPSSLLDRLGRIRRQLWAILWFAVKRFVFMDGPLWASAFAFNAFFSLFPLIVLLVTFASSVIDRDRAGKEVIAYVESYVPISGEMQRQIFDTMAGVINARESAGAIALLMLLWSSLQLFNTLISATNRAWGTESYNWWRLPLASLALLNVVAMAVILGMALPVLMHMAKAWLLPGHDLRSWVYEFSDFIVPSLVMFIGLCLFYRLAPRRNTRFAEVWASALCVTVLLRTGEYLFVIYLKNFATLNAVYGAFGGIIALLLWIYLSGCIFIFGACLCAGQAEVFGRPNPAALIHIPPNVR